MNSDHPKLLIWVHRQKPCAKSTGTDSTPGFVEGDTLGYSPFALLEMLTVTGRCMFCPPYKVGPKSPVFSGVTHFVFGHLKGLHLKNPAFKLGSGPYLVGPKIHGDFAQKPTVFWEGISGPNSRSVQPAQGVPCCSVLQPKRCKAAATSWNVRSRWKTKAKLAKVSTPHVSIQPRFCL